MINAKEKLIQEIENAPESVVIQLLEILTSIKRSPQKTQLKNTESSLSQDIDDDPLLEVIGIFDGEAMSSEEIDQELYG
ncbi:MAG: hypothetical protein AB4041_14755 [Microcystaceae cyanobacterium]